MKVEAMQKIQARIREIDESLRDLEACEMTEGWLSCGTGVAEAAALYHEREQLLHKLAKAV